MNLPVTKKCASANQWMLDYITQQNSVKQLNQTALQSLVVKQAGAAPVDSSFLDKVKNIDFKALLENPAVLAGLGSAAVGGGLTLAGERRKNESFGDKVLRALGNAGISGALGGGAVGLLNAGTSNITEALPKEDVDPVTANVNSPLMKGLGALTGFGAAQKFIKDPYQDRSTQAVKNLLSKVTGTSREANKLKNALNSDDKGRMLGSLEALFGGRGGDLKANAASKLFGPTSAKNLDALKQELRYLGINPENKQTWARLGEGLKGSLMRGTDLRSIGGVGGRGLRLTRGVGGAVAGLALPSLLSAASNYIQNRE